MKNLYSTILAIVCITFTARAQINYTFTAVPGTYTPISGGTSPVLIDELPADASDSLDDGFANALPISFNFTYNGTVYTTISVSTNGFTSFANFLQITDDQTQGYYFDELQGGAYGPSTVRPVLAPLWDDLNILNPTDIKYITTGTAPTRVFTLEWNNVLWEYDAASPAISFQLKLFETTNIVEFQYSQEAGDANLPEASIGITASGTGPNNFLSLNDASTAPTASSTLSTDNISEKPATGQIYRFTPLSTTPVTLSYFAGERQNNVNVLTWLILTEQNSKGFMLERSADGSHFEDIGFVSTNAPGGNSTSPIKYLFEDKKPLNGNNYYRLKQINNDGRITYSQVILVNSSIITKLKFRKIYPVPTINLLSLVIDAPANNKIDFKIIDITGKIVMQHSNELAAGTNSLYLNVAKLAAGKYILKGVYGANGESIITKFVKQ